MRADRARCAAAGGDRRAAQERRTRERFHSQHFWICENLDASRTVCPRRAPTGTHRQTQAPHTPQRQRARAPRPPRAVDGAATRTPGTSLAVARRDARAVGGRAARRAPARDPPRCTRRAPRGTPPPCACVHPLGGVRPARRGGSHRHRRPEPQSSAAGRSPVASRAHRDQRRRWRGGPSPPGRGSTVPAALRRPPPTAAAAAVAGTAAVVRPRTTVAPRHRRAPRPMPEFCSLSARSPCRRQSSPPTASPSAAIARLRDASMRAPRPPRRAWRAWLPLTAHPPSRRVVAAGVAGPPPPPTCARGFVPRHRRRRRLRHARC